MRWGGFERKGPTMEIRALVVDDSGMMRKMVMRALAESRLAQFAFTEA
jgi:chemotaxis response regulator CheB